MCLSYLGALPRMKIQNNWENKNSEHYLLQFNQNSARFKLSFEMVQKFWRNTKKKKILVNISYWILRK